MTNELSDEEFLELAYERLFRGDCFDEGEIDRLLSLAKKGIKAQKLKEALEFYENTNRLMLDVRDVKEPEIFGIQIVQSKSIMDNGKIARAALKEFNDD